MIRIHNIRTRVEEQIDLYQIVSHKLKINKNDILQLQIHKKSIDARNKQMFAYVFDVDVKLKNEAIKLTKDMEMVVKEDYELPCNGLQSLSKRPVIIGAGPAGLFAAYMLSQYGYKPIIMERGEPIEQRVKDVSMLWQHNDFKKNSNVQFGEGGAGTFSDGKLNTLVKDKNHRIKKVLEIFVECGAPEEILYDSKPHIGTDILQNVIINMRKQIITWGGEFYYESCLEDIILKNNRIKSIIVNGEEIETDLLILAIGHSARDTFSMLLKRGLNITSKPFAVGVRIIHSQEMIDQNQYPINYPFLPPATYKLTYKSSLGRGVYSFCMCPGGYVVNARSDDMGVCVNGMSNYKRDSGYANSAIIVTVGPDDYGKNPLDGMYFQEKIEQKAWQLTAGAIPVQKYNDYKIGVISSGNVLDAFKGQTKFCNLQEILPDYINSAIIEGVDYFDTKIKGFGRDEALIAGPETRTSSPIRMIRDENLESNILGIYPCGEGSGYAGGITTSAVDGLKVFESIYKMYKSPQKYDIIIEK